MRSELSEKLKEKPNLKEELDNRFDIAFEENDEDEISKCEKELKALSYLLKYNERHKMQISEIFM